MATAVAPSPADKGAVVVVDKAAKGVADASYREEYAAKLRKLAALHKEHAPLPSVEIRYTNVSYTLDLPQNQVSVLPRPAS